MGPERPRSEGHTLTEQPPKKPRGPLEPRTYRDALLNCKAAILLDRPENKLFLGDHTGRDWQTVSKNPGRGTPTSPILQTGQRSVDWLTGALNSFQIKESTKMKTVDAKHLPQLLKMALRIWDEVSTGSELLLNSIESLNPGLHLDTWKVLDSKDETTGR
ncbi:hypothetical protein Cfor_07944 [Coptotermes formosanus]|uniref:DUF4780 domain-containing protein n=1 Tax=Coptotermes formosanus TaxID=36987 RepID=A0A6L2PGP6_COPFO|nr:hypothetical protein Cfor_07944 [Coptotermes formosanus]